MEFPFIIERTFCKQYSRTILLNYKQKCAELNINYIKLNEYLVSKLNKTCYIKNDTLCIEDYITRKILTNLYENYKLYNKT